MKIDDIDLSKLDLSRLTMEEKLQVYELMRHYMPYDLADAYFPVRRELVRVEGL